MRFIGVSGAERAREQRGARHVAGPRFRQCAGQREQDRARFERYHAAGVTDRAPAGINDERARGQQQARARHCGTLCFEPDNRRASLLGQGAHGAQRRSGASMIAARTILRASLVGIAAVLGMNAAPAGIASSDSSKPIAVNADSFVADLNGETGVYTGNVIVTQGRVRLHAEQASAHLL